MIISNSNIEAYQKCERQFYYAVLKGLRPKTLPVFLRRGTFGHKMLEDGFNALIAGGSTQDAISAAGIELQRLMASDDPEKPEMMKVYRHVITFFNWLEEKAPWRPVATEETILWDLVNDKRVPTDNREGYRDGLVFALTPDIVVEFQNGPYRGQHAILDYKFVGQYMREAVVELAVQPWKYAIYRMKAEPKFNIRRSAFVQFNTRADANATGHKLFLLKWVEFTKQRLSRIEYENQVMVKRIDTHVRTATLDGSIEPVGDNFIRTVNKNTCDQCFFQSICKAEYDGKDATKIIERDYVKNEYGY